MADQEIEVLGRVCEDLSRLEDNVARRRVLEFAAAKYGITGFNKPQLGEPANGQAAITDDGGMINGQEDFLSRHSHDKPADNVHLLAASHYSRYGSQLFTVAELKIQADEAGLDIPDRIDMTLKGAGKAGKRFYRNHGGGAFSVTVNGAAFLKDKYKIRKGTQKKPLAAAGIPG